MKSSSINLLTIKRQLAKLLAPIVKHRTLIVILLALLSIIITVYKMEGILTKTEDQNYYSQSRNKNAVKTHFDQETIDKIQKLHDPLTNHSVPNLPSGRINPFTK